MSTKSELIENLRDKEYRHAYVAARIQKDIAYQIRTLRQKKGWSQKELAEKAGMKQSRISQMENPNNARGYQTETLKRIAAVFDIGVIVRLGTFSEIVEWSDRLSPDSLAPPSFDDEYGVMVQESKAVNDLDAVSDWEDDPPSVSQTYPEDKAA